MTATPTAIQAMSHSGGLLRHPEFMPHKINARIGLYSKWRWCRPIREPLDSGSASRTSIISDATFAGPDSTVARDGPGQRRVD